MIATQRIDAYNKENNTVTFHYNRHEDNAYIEKTIPAIEFIQLLMQHIPEKNFKMIRYYGIYGRHREIDKKLHRVRSSQQQNYLMSLNKWRSSILLSFGYDPISCPCCHKEMKLLELYYNHKKVSLEDLYESRTLAFQRLINLFYSLRNLLYNRGKGGVHHDRKRACRETSQTV